MSYQTKINWYPGHMEKARRQMMDTLKLIDILVEMRDSRMPEASINPFIQAWSNQKYKLIILTKIDEADPLMTQKWIETYTTETTMCIGVDLMHDSKASKKVISAIKQLGKPLQEKQMRKGIRPRALRAMVCGVPNVGKSTLINRLIGKNTLKAQDRPGVTKALTWITLDGVELLDTPGVLWPKFQDQKTGIILAGLGSINDDIVNKKMLVLDLISIIQKRYPDVLENLVEDQGNPNQILKAYAKKRNCVGINQELDIQKAAMTFLVELRKGGLGRLTLEHPDENSEEM